MKKNNNIRINVMNKEYKNYHSGWRHLIKLLVITIIVLLICIKAAFCTNYYFAASGSDAGAGTIVSPWQTITKVNSIQSSLVAGDSVLFNRGDTFYGAIVVAKSSVIYAAYGTGANPVITGFINVTAWTNLGSNIWESTSAVSTLSTCNMVVINGVNTAMGRTPNTGYYTYQSWSGSTQITSSSLNSSVINYTGAQAVIRKNNYVTDRCTITNQSGSTITFTDPVGAFTSTNNYGFFIQNDVRTLDVQNEWYYNPSTFKIRIYSTSSPTNVKVSTIDNLFTISSSYSGIVINGIDFTGANTDCITFSGHNTTVKKCNISFGGNNCIESVAGNNSLIDSNSISTSGKAGIFYNSTNTGAVITHNSILYSGVIEGQVDNGSQTNGIFSTNTNVSIQYNVVKYTGSHGIFSKGDTTLIQYNFLDSLILTTTDQGGIYTHKKTTIDHNIVLDALGNGSGSNGNNVPEGIYLDDDVTFSNHNQVTNNTVAYSNNAGIKIHQNSDDLIRGNTLYDNVTWQIYLQDNAGMARDTIRSNIFFSKLSTQFCYGYVNSNNNIASVGVADSNYFARPIDDNLTFQTYQANTGYVNRSLATWQSFTGLDANSAKSPKIISDTNDIRFEYNATTSPKVVSLSFAYVDVTGYNNNTGTVTIAPYSSWIGIKNGSVIIINPGSISVLGNKRVR